MGNIADPEGRMRCWYCHAILRIDQEKFCSEECQRHWEWIAENSTEWDDD